MEQQQQPTADASTYHRDAWVVAFQSLMPDARESIALMELRNDDTDANVILAKLEMMGQGTDKQLVALFLKHLVTGLVPVQCRAWLPIVTAEAQERAKQPHVPNQIGDDPMQFLGPWERAFFIMMPDVRRSISLLELREDVKQDGLVLLEKLRRDGFDDTRLARLLVKHSASGLIPAEFVPLLQQ